MEPSRAEQESRFEIERQEDRIAPTSENIKPGQFTTGKPPQTPPQSNPNEVPATNPSNDR